MSEILIQKVTLTDIEQLQQIGKKTFAETFASDNSKENILEYLDEKFSIEELKSELTDKNSYFYFAVLGDGVIGYLKINLGQTQTDIMMKLQM